MARDRQLIGALIGSLLLHGSLLYLPLNPAGLAHKANSVDRWMFVVTGAVVRTGVQSEATESPSLVKATVSARVVSSSLPESPQSAPTNRSARSDGVLPGEFTAAPDSFRGTEDVALVTPLTMSAVYYHRASEMTHQPALQAPVLREEAGRLYPVSETLLSVRINEHGEVDLVSVLSRTESTISAEALDAFQAARYYPGRIGRRPVKAELLIHVRSGPERMIVTPIER